MHYQIYVLVLSCAFLMAHAQEDDLQCYTQGECPNASFLPPTSAESYNECLTQCQADDRCQWLTFFPQEKLCMLMVSCPDGPTAECGEPCFSGEAKCPKQPLQCNVDGLWCEDPSVGLFTDVEDLRECQDTCYQDPLCQWYNFDESTNACLLTASCYVSTNTCATCTAGQKECLVKNPGLKKLMAIGGVTGTYTAEVIDLSGDPVTCPKVEASPFEYASTGAFVDGRAMLCAGHNEPNRCYTYENETNTWAILNVLMKDAYHYREGVVLSDGRWWISGGRYDVTLDTEIFNPEDQTFEPFTALPRPANMHVMLSLNDSAVVFLGGTDNDYGDVWVLDLETSNWSYMPSMPEARDSLAAGLATFPDGSRQLVVTGGEKKTSTNIFDFDTNLWRRTTNDLPYDIQYASSVQFQDTFLIVGGMNSSSQYLSTIFEFDPASESWIERAETLQRGNIVTAFLIPDDYIECVPSI